MSNRLTRKRTWAAGHQRIIDRWARYHESLARMKVALKVALDKLWGNEMDERLHWPS